MIEPITIGVVTAVFTGGAAWGGAKVALNGTRNRVKKMETDFETHMRDDQMVQREMVDRLARIETKLELALYK